MVHYRPTLVRPTEPEIKEMFPNCHVEFKNCGWLDFIDGMEVFVPFDILDDFEGGEIELMFTQNCM